jgi:integrase
MVDLQAPNLRFTWQGPLVRSQYRPPYKLRLRVSELVSLRQGDINLKQGVIRQGRSRGATSPEVSISSHIRHRTAAMYASERIAP